MLVLAFFFNDTATTEIYTLSLHDALPISGTYGFGRVDMIENRRVGIKSRELYEVPGALAIILAHRALEDLTLEREVAHHKPLVEQRWTDLVYDGQWFSPLRIALDAYVDATQTHVSGDVRLRF